MSDPLSSGSQSGVRDEPASPVPSGGLFSKIPAVLWAPLSAGALMLAIGLLGILAKQPLLFPSLGPTAFLQTENPGLRVSRFYNTVVGHLVGLASGAAVLLLLHASLAPSPLETGQLVPVRVYASALAVVLTMGIGILLHASHPPATATTLLVTLGGFRLDLQTVLVVISGVLLVGILGEGLRRARLGREKRVPD